GGPLRHSNFYARHFKPAVLRAGLPEETRFHDLRHSYAAMLIAEGAHPRAIMERMGHSTIQVTLGTYGHLFPTLEAALTDPLDAAYRQAEPARPAAVRGIERCARCLARILVVDGSGGVGTVSSMIDSLSEYLRTLLRHWGSLVVGIGGAILTWIAAFVDPPIDNLRVLGAVILGVAVLYA